MVNHRHCRYPTRNATNFLFTAFPWTLSGTPATGGSCERSLTHPLQTTVRSFRPSLQTVFLCLCHSHQTCALQKFDANKRYYKTNDDNMRGGVTEVFMTHFLLAPALPPSNPGILEGGTSATKIRVSCPCSPCGGQDNCCALEVSPFSQRK